MSNPIILIAHDDPSLVQQLSAQAIETIKVKDTKELLLMAPKVQPQLIILGTSIGQNDGIETCMQIRQLHTLRHTLVIFVSENNYDYVLLAAFEAGADDYIFQPIAPKVLATRLRALLRRWFAAQEKPNKLQFKELSIDKEAYKISLRGRSQILPRKEFELLLLLCSQVGKVFKRDDILHQVWGDDTVVGGRTLDVHVRKLREKIGQHRIVTIKGVGYQFADI